MQNFVAIAIFMGDGSYNMIKVMALSALSWNARRAAAKEARDEEEDHQVVASPRGSLRTTSMRIVPFEDPKVRGSNLSFTTLLWWGVFYLVLEVC
jgi:hypothetical protein